MVSFRSSCSVFGGMGHHVTALAAILICSLVLIAAQPASNTDGLKLLNANEAHTIHRQPPSHLHHHRPSSPSRPSSFSSNDDVNKLATNFDSEEQKEPSTSDESHMMSSEAEPEPEDGDSTPTNRFVPPNLTLEEWKRMYERGAIPADLSKRFLQGFVGSRGKRSLNAAAAAPSSMYEGGISIDDLSKRFIQGFVGSRGKRVMEEEEDEGVAGAGKSYFPVTESLWRAPDKRFYPSGFTASRGKRYMPGLEALLLSQMYKKLDAEKWKRQSMLGFHASRG
ncbi:hypothetical protein ACOMHN_046031 [Nucella lapillus]